MQFRFSFFFAFLSCLALTSAQNENTGAGIIANLNGLSLVYVNLTVSPFIFRYPHCSSADANLQATVNKLGFNTPQLASSLVKQYQDITTTELADEQAPQPQTAFNETIQYGILSAYHSVRLPSPNLEACLLILFGQARDGRHPLSLRFGGESCAVQ